MRPRRVVLLGLLVALPWALLELGGAASHAGALSGDLAGDPAGTLAGLACALAWLVAVLAGPPLLAAGVVLGLCAQGPRVLRSAAWMRLRGSRSSSRVMASSSS